MVGTMAKAIAKAQPFEIWPSKSPDFKGFRVLNGRISVLHFISSNFCRKKMTKIKVSYPQPEHFIIDLFRSTRDVIKT